MARLCLSTRIVLSSTTLRCWAYTMRPRSPPPLDAPFAAARGLSRSEAARYIGVSVGTLDRLVDEGVMPKPKTLRARVVYDRVELDRAFDALGEPSAANDFDS